MKTLIRLAAIITAAITMIACGEKKGGKDEHVDISGEWKLESLNGTKASELAKDEFGGLDLYLSFGQDGKFETFQRMTKGKIYVRYNGSYQTTNSTVSGEYEDGTFWVTSYSAKVENDVLTMSGLGDECVYTKTAIPDEVRKNAIVPVKSNADENIPTKFL